MTFYMVYEKKKKQTWYTIKNNLQTLFRIEHRNRNSTVNIQATKKSQFFKYISSKTNKYQILHFNSK